MTLLLCEPTETFLGSADEHTTRIEHQDCAAVAAHRDVVRTRRAIFSKRTVESSGAHRAGASLGNTIHVRSFALPIHNKNACTNPRNVSPLIRLLMPRSTTDPRPHTMSIRLAPRHVTALRRHAKKTDLSEAEIIRRLIDIEFGLKKRPG